MNAWHPIYWFMLFLWVVPTAVASTQIRDPYQYFFETTFGDFPEELARAKSEGKQGIMFFFELDECPFCHRMKDTVLNQPVVQDYFRKHFLLFSVDVEGQTEVVNFAGKTLLEKNFAEKENRVRATPVFVFFGLDGKPIARYTGATSGVEEFLWLGEYVVDGHYKKQSFIQYKRAKRAR